MSGLFGTLNTSTKGLTVNQAALQTTSHNISNANTEGYSRQRVNMEASSPYTLAGVGQLGTGVNISSVVRVVDSYVNSQLRNETSHLERYQQKSEILGQLEAIFNEPSETGLSNSLNELFSSWDYLGSNPELTTAKTLVAQNAETLTDTLHHMSNQIESLYNGTISDIEKNVLDFNSKLEQLDALNKQIFNVSVKGQTPNDLLDKQEKLLGELAGISDISISTDEYHRATVSVDGQEILGTNSLQKLSVVTGHDDEGNTIISKNGSTSETISSGGDYFPGQLIIVDESDAGTVYFPIEINSGSIRGAQESLEKIDQSRQELNDLAFTLATAVNVVHSNNGEGTAFFDLGADGNYAANLKVNEEILKDPTKINAGAGLTDSLSGDGSRAQAIGEIRNTLLTFPADPDAIEYDPESMSIKNQTGGSTIANEYNGMVTQVGITKQQADNMTANQEDLVFLLQARRESVSGVSINEEVTDIIKYQSAFQANSRIITVVSEMLDTLINRTGV